MRKAILVFSLLGLVVLQSGCTIHPGSDLLFPKGNGEKIITTSSQFDEIASNPENYVGQEIKLAGAVVSIDQTDEGFLTLAKWLPYPKTQADKGPTVNHSDGNQHFLIRFVGKREKVFHTTRGNRFLLEGKVEGTKKALVNIFAPKENLLYVNTKCVHIWETGEGEINGDNVDSEFSQTRERTLCAD